ncbi:MAG: CoA transferase [Dehalococcoidia bacterium]|jgi:formyl-CoA transferase
MSGPLEGIRVLDWTQWQMGTVATTILADFGAEVIHIENRLTGDNGRGLHVGGKGELPEGKSSYFEHNNRGKKSIAIDLSKAMGKDILYRLVSNSDVFVHNFRQGVPERIKMDYETLRQYNPKLIYAAASGFGCKGPEAIEPAFDMLGLARAGVISILGESDEKPSIPHHGGIADQIGAIMTSYGVLLALISRNKSGIGQKVDVSQLSAVMWLFGLPIGIWLYNRGSTPSRDRSCVPNPLWNYYKCKDERWIALGMLQSDRYWPTLCKGLGIEHLERDPRYNGMAGRASNCRELIAVIDSIFIQRTVAEWMEILKKTGDIICTPVQTIPDLINDPQVIANEYIVDSKHEVLGPVQVLGLPVAMSQTPGSIKSEAPECGQHTEEVLLEVGGYTWDDITSFREAEII